MQLQFKTPLKASLSEHSTSKSRLNQKLQTTKSHYKKGNSQIITHTSTEINRTAAQNKQMDHQNEIFQNK